MAKKDNELINRENTTPIIRNENVIQLGPQAALDLTGLTEEQKRQLKYKHAEGLVDVSKKAAELSADTSALGAKLDTMAEHTNDVVNSGGSVTITNVNDDSLGRTEIMMGTSEAARRGKFTRTQSGGRDYMLIWVGFGVFIVIVIALVVTGLK